jgi:predicted component of type VI protein secretion system
MMSLDFDPLADYSPEDIDVSKIKEISLSAEQVAELKSKIDASISTAGTIKEVLAVLTDVGKFAIQIGVKSLADGSLDNLMG